MPKRYSLEEIDVKFSADNYGTSPTADKCFEQVDGRYAAAIEEKDGLFSVGLECDYFEDEDLNKVADWIQEWRDKYCS